MEAEGGMQIIRREGKPTGESMASRRLLLSYFSVFFVVLFFFPVLISAARCHPEDKAALLDIKKAMGDPYILISWDPKVDCCSWLALKCDPKTNRVSELAIGGDNVSGTISPSVSKLKSLTQLTMRKLTGLTGPIPTAICDMTTLTFLWLDWNELSGTIPACLSKLRSLTYINLSFNQLTGEIPASLALLEKLDAIFIDHNRLTGRIPESFGHFRGSTPYLRLSHNNLIGEIPASLGAMNFVNIDLSRNMLEGDASFLFGSTKPTQVLDISRNQNLSFDLSTVSFPKTLITINIHHNKIYGAIPKSILKLSNLQQLNVSYNRLCGKIPQGANLKRFDEYSFWHNKCLCGPPLTPSCS
ncbi:Polygalacturonase inhibitor [Nymphaea thermarum]|nr:Polygalacturonase inhibitor [Nymphaea thermarum]